MVHALEKTGRFLRPGGCLLDIHDLVDPPRIEIHARDQQVFAGQLLSTSGFESQRQADQAMDQVIQRGLFSSTHSKIFENFIRADSIDSMEACLAEDWESAYMTSETHRTVEALAAGLGEETQVVLRMISRITRLDPVKSCT